MPKLRSTGLGRSIGPVSNNVDHKENRFHNPSASLQPTGRVQRPSSTSDGSRPLPTPPSGVKRNDDRPGRLLPTHSNRQSVGVSGRLNSTGAPGRHNSTGAPGRLNAPPPPPARVTSPTEKQPTSTIPRSAPPPPPSRSVPPPPPVSINHVSYMSINHNYTNMLLLIPVHCVIHKYIISLVTGMYH